MFYWKNKLDQTKKKETEVNNFLINVIVNLTINNNIKLDFKSFLTKRWERKRKWLIQLIHHLVAVSSRWWQINVGPLGDSYLYSVCKARIIDSLVAAPASTGQPGQPGQPQWPGMGRGEAKSGSGEDNWGQKSKLWQNLAEFGFEHTLFLLIITLSW